MLYFFQYRYSRYQLHFVAISSFIIVSGCHKNLHKSNDKLWRVRAGVRSRVITFLITSFVWTNDIKLNFNQSPTFEIQYYEIRLPHSIGQQKLMIFSLDPCINLSDVVAAEFWKTYPKMMKNRVLIKILFFSPLPVIYFVICNFRKHKYIYQNIVEMFLFYFLTLLWVSACKYYIG